MVVAATTLVDFPGFQDVHEVIFNVVNVRYEPDQSHYDPEEWEIYVKYRQLLSEFLTDQRRSGTLFVGTVPVNPGIGKCGNVCGDRVRRQNPLGKNVTNFTKSHDLSWARLAK